jgi:hypothetical protein
MATPAAVLIGKPQASNLRVKIGSLALARGRDLERAGRLYRARPWLLFANLLSFYDLARAIAKTRIRALIQASSLVLGLVASLVLSKVAGWEAWLALLAGSIISGLDFGFEIRNLRDEDVGCVIVDISGDVDRAKLLPQTVTTSGNLLNFTSSYALYDRTVNAELSRQSTAEASDLTLVAWSDDTSPLPYKVQQWRRQILLNRYRGAKANRPFNGALVRQVTSSESIAQHQDRPIEMQTTRYFDLMCSNYLTESYVEDRRTGSKVLYGVDLIRDTNGQLPSLESSDLANAVGVSTLAFDSRNKLILIQQSEFAQSSQNLWSPSGSGSLEPNDVHKAAAQTAAQAPLVDVIRRGMNRELVEESHIRERIIADSRVIAYFRWLNKGAKPEYVALYALGERLRDEAGFRNWLLSR